MTKTALSIGYVLRAGTTEFAVGCRVLEPNTPQFGDFVKVTVGQTEVIGLVYNVQINDDPAVRQLILTGSLSPEAIQDQRLNRLVPIEVSVLVVGYAQNGRFVQNLPPQPPISLDTLQPCPEKEIIAFTERLDFLRLILRANHLPADDLLVAILGRAAASRAPQRPAALPDCRRTGRSSPAECRPAADGKRVAPTEPAFGTTGGVN